MKAFIKICTFAVLFILGTVISFLGLFIICGFIAMAISFGGAGKHGRSARSWETCCRKNCTKVRTNSIARFDLLFADCFMVFIIP